MRLYFGFRSNNYLRIRNCNQLQESPNKSGARIIRYVAGLY